jgi:hypothetical protein
MKTFEDGTSLAGFSVKVPRASNERVVVSPAGVKRILWLKTRCRSNRHE